MSHAARNMGSLSLVYSQHAVAAMEEAMGKLAVVGVVSSCSSRFKEPLVHEVAEMMKQFLANAGRMAAGQQQVAAPKGAQNRDLQVMLEVQSRELYITTSVLESSADVGTTPETLKAEARREVLVQLMGAAVQELSERRTYKALAAWVEGERSTRNMLGIVREREKLASVEAARLAEEMRVEEDESRADRERQEAEIAELKQKLAEAKAKAAIDGKVLKKELKARGDTAKRVQGEREVRMIEEIAQLKKSIEIEDKVSEMMSTYLEEKHGRLQTTVNEWMNKYDVDTESLQRQLEQLRAQKSNDLERLYELRERSREMEEVIAKKRTAAALQKEYEELQTRKATASVRIQAVWRGYMARKQFKAMKRKLAAKARKKGKGGAQSAAGGGRLPKIK